MTPVVIHIPHSSYFIPNFIRENILVTDEELEQDAYAFTDWRTKDIFTHRDFPDRVVFPVSRMVCDPERFRNDEDEPMSKVGIGSVYVKDAYLRRFRTVTSLEKELMLRHFYDVHHRKLENAVEGCLKRHGSCLIIDAHSFSGTPLPYEPEQSPDRPDICIGTCQEHTSKLLERKAVRFFQKNGLKVSVNYPYSGTMVPLRYWMDPRVESIMVEINRSLYQRMEGLFPSSGYSRIKNLMGRFLMANLF
ncbi:MAG: N-formylglutamate amidohydrolase [Victivallales bacterium]|nr:N-formylglutamate amidohydrolase [Victivallales bacterium]